jgi:hypothetical protein
VSQPTDRRAVIAQPGKLNTKLGEFWSDNPWRIVAGGHNLSSYERNRFFINSGGARFLEASYLSGADSDGDGRAAVAADLFNRGRMDLLVRQAGGGAFLLLENQMDCGRSLKITLEGSKSNRQGIGARVIAETNERTLSRENFPANSYNSQSPAIIHLGLGKTDKIKVLKVLWPSGIVQIFNEIPAEGHLTIKESKTGPNAIMPFKAAEKSQ